MGGRGLWICFFGGCVRESAGLELERIVFGLVISVVVSFLLLLIFEFLLGSVKGYAKLVKTYQSG